MDVIMDKSTPSDATNIPKPGKKKWKRRAFLTTDSEWDAVGEQAEKAGLNISAYIRQKLFHDIPSEIPTAAGKKAEQLPISSQWELLNMVQLQQRLWEEYYAAAGRQDQFEHLKQDVINQNRLKKGVI
jgi:hypothetical protein